MAKVLFVFLLIVKVNSKLINNNVDGMFSQDIEKNNGRQLDGK